MDNITNVTLEPRANVYFDGQVTSRSFIMEDGSRKTLGIMMPGEYSFGTSQNELMEILAGDLDVQLPGETQWIKLGADQSFSVPANSEFKVRIHRLTDYCCSYS